MKKFIKIFIIKFGGYISLILAAMLIIAYFFTVMYNFFNLNNIATFSLLHKEQQQSDIALQEYFNQVADSAAYIIYSEDDSIFDELRKFFPDLDITKKVYIDANGEVIPNMRQRKAFDTISTSAEDHASDHYGRDLNNSVIDPTLLRTLNQMLNNDDAFDVNILYAEGFVQPLPVVYDYRRCYVDEQGNIIDYVYVKKYDPETGVWLNPDEKIGTMIYEYVASEVDEDGNVINYEVDSMPTTTPYGTEKYGLKRIFYDTDEKGNPIVPKGYPTPQKHIQLAPVEDEYGNILLSSPIRFNADTTKTKKEIMADIDYEIVRQRVEGYIAETYGNQLVDIDTYNSIYYMKLSEYIEEKKEGKEGVDWEWDYKGKSKLMSILDKNGNYILNPDISEKDFRYHIRKIDGKIVEVDMALEDPSYTNKCDEDYAWNEYLNFPVYRYEPENPVELAPRTLKDFGLAPVLLYDRAIAVSFKQLLYVDGKYDADAAQKYVTTHYNNQFTKANDGFFPAKIYETDEEFKKVTTNDEVVDYLYNFVGSVDHLFTDKTVGKNGEWLGLSDWEKNNEEYNKEIKILSPYISNIGSKKDQIINPENYDEKYYNYLNKDRQITVNNFWVPVVNNILDSTIYKAQFIDDEVNNINNIPEELKSHPQYQKIVNDINSLGKVILTDSSMTEDLFLIKEAVNPFGNFEYTYRKEARTERMLADHEQKAILTAYQVGRHWKALNWIVTYEIEKEKEVNDIEENEDGTIVILPTKHTETYTEEIQVDTIPVNLEVYSNDIPDLEYDDSDSGKVIAKGFIPNSDYKTAYDIKVPSYTVEYDGEGVVKKVKFKLEIEDNRNNGKIKYVYRYYAGDVKTVKPYPEETYFNGEVYSSWYNRLTTDQPGISYKAIEEEQESYFSYLKAYFTNYEMDIPKSAEKDPYAYERTEEGYTDTIQHIVNKQISPETKAYGGTIIKALEQPQWKKIFTKMGLDQKYHKELVAQVIMGLIEEEQKQNDPNKKGICGIYVEPNETTIDAKRQWDNKDAISFTLIVNSTEDQRLDPGLSIQYMVAELGNLIMRFNGDICKAIQGYEMGGDALYNQINTILPLTDMDDFAATYDWSKNIIEYLKSTYHTTYTQRSKEEMLYFARQYGRPSMVDCNPRIVEDVIGYVNSYANQVKLAETTTKWYQEIWEKVKETVKDVGNYGKTLLEKMGLLTSSKDQQITRIKNHNHEDYWIIFLRMVVAARQGIELEDVDEDITIFDLLNTIMSGDYIPSNYTGMSSSISDFSGLIYNYEDYVIPLENFTITSGYGWRFHPTDKEIKFHNGIDLAANSGTPIHAVANGEVIVSGWNNSAGYWVCIKHPVEENNDKDYIISIYMHMNKQPNVRVGDKVKAGQVIGFVGSTGKSTGPHLHFELRINISQNNPNYSVWMSLVANQSTNSINPFWFSVNNPTPEQISKFSITKDRNSVVIK